MLRRLFEAKKQRAEGSASAPVQSKHFAVEGEREMATPTHSAGMSPPSQSSPTPSLESSVKVEIMEPTDADMSDDDDVSDIVSPDDAAPSTSASAQEHGNPLDSESSHDPQSMPVQKRRRVTRACDECRRKKIKCDGKQPCTHCQVYSYDCTYDKPSNRRRNPAPQYIEALENKLQRAEALLRTFMPDIDLNDPNLDPSVQQEFRLREQARAQGSRNNDPAGRSSPKDERMLSMISSVGQLDLNENRDYDFHGLSSGTVFFKRMKEHFRTLLGRDYQVPLLPRRPMRSSGLGVASPGSTVSSQWERGTTPGLCQLPSKEVSQALCSYAINYATCVLRILHRPSFFEMVDKLYEKSPENYSTEDNRNAALLYSVMALGCMYNVSDEMGTGPPPYEAAIEQGLKYYDSARLLLQDITECRDLTSLQALLFMTLFIQSMSNLSTCYGFVGIALRSALRMGLHRNVGHDQLNPVELETSRRVFYVCRQLDIYVSALLGFPMLLNDEDVDQPLPTPVDDEFVTKEGILPVPSDTPSFFEAFNAHAQLMDILSKIIKYIYPLKGIEQTAADGKGQVNATYKISYTKVKDMEKALQQWYEKLPTYWRPNPDGPEEVVRVRNLLRFAYAHVQMVLYRPFIHFVSPRVSANKNVDERSYACGAAGISVARNIVHIGVEMRRQVSLVGPYWYTHITEFFAIISLVFFVLENQDKPGTMEILADATAGKQMIDKLARKNPAADRVSQALKVLFDQLPDNLKKVKAKSFPTKKRSAPGLKSSSTNTLASSIPPSKTASRRPEDSKRSKSRLNIGRGTSASAQPNPSYDRATSQGQNLDVRKYSPGMQPVSPISINVATPDAVTMGPFQGSTAATDSLQAIDAMMFTSDDPLAYPNLPRVEMGQPQHQNSVSPANVPQQDASQFFMPNMYDNIEGQLMGPLPPYLIQVHGQNGFDFPAQMYSDPMLNLQVQQNHFRQQRQPSQQQQFVPSQPQQQQQQQPPPFTNSPWPGMFGNFD